MKRAWQENPEVVKEVEEAMRLAKSAAFDDDYFDDDYWSFESESDDDSCEGVDNEGMEMDAGYVKENFDRLYVKKVVRWIEEGKNVFVTGSQGRGKSTCMKKVIQELYRTGHKLLVTGIDWDLGCQYLRCCSKGTRPGNRERSATERHGLHFGTSHGSQCFRVTPLGEQHFTGIEKWGNGEGSSGRDQSERQWQRWARGKARCIQDGPNIHGRVQR